MRAAISFLIVGFLFGSFAVGTQKPNTLLSPADSSFISAKLNKPKTLSPKPPKPTPYRGSGRRELMEYKSTFQPAV